MSTNVTSKAPVCTAIAVALSGATVKGGTVRRRLTTLVVARSSHKGVPVLFVDACRATPPPLAVSDRKSASSRLRS